jgi:tetratricopeptide (TPR) repeat protein
VPPAPPAANVEEDLSLVFVEIPRPAVPEPPRSAADIDDVFAQLREEAAHRPGDESADAAFTRGAAMYDAGQLDAAVEQFRGAARFPGRRFAAASMLARIYREQKQIPEAIEWLGHAVDAPGLTAAERFDTLLLLADLLETSGEAASALAVCLELQAEAGDYNDLAVRIARLSRAQAGG